MRTWLKPTSLLSTSAIFAWSCLVAGTPISAAGQEHPAEAKKRSGAELVPALLAEVERHYARAGSLTAEFSQEETSATFGDRKLSTGTLSWKAPNLLRWETTKPEPGLVVSNGKTLWIYTPPFDETENGQVIVKKASQVKSKLLDALLAGKFSQAQKQGLRIKSVGPREFLLAPKKDSALKQARVSITEADPIISKLALDYQDGNRATIELSNIKMGNAAAREPFEFKVPPKTDVVKE
ncbi:MAG: outer rane lipoprotein carrier protein LolA [Pseudomonadota bacterium]|jgi:outer membrane lipoprotein carrier protein